MCMAKSHNFSHTLKNHKNKCLCDCLALRKEFIFPAERSVEVTREGHTDVEGESAERTSPIQSASGTT